ncbi:ABC transporter permease [Paenibacillus sp. HW567]|uniref:ABC transporter permease n=1 Tax=Paenibacillus sp. HW567 TaxID=1034769 RepID=UPI00035C3E1C|nr:ABC transporter permease [Paenibacillus sp. HW567]
MGSLIKAERMKLQYPVIVSLFLTGALGTVMLGVNSLNSENFVGFYVHGWKTFYLHMSSFHGLFLYPLYTGVLASLLCRYEHMNGGWKQLYCLPVRRSRLYFAKLGTLMLLLGWIQLLFAGTYLLAGGLLQLGNDLDFAELLIGTAGGWLAILPFAALQLWVSTRLRSFVSSLILSASIVIANIVLTGLHASIGAWFPSTTAYYAMYPRGTALSPRLEVIPFILIVAVTSGLYIWAGRRSLTRGAQL